MKVTIITVTYNSAIYLEQCIQSVIGQHYHDIEHIIVDGGSTDGTLDIIAQYQSKIAKWVSEPDHCMYDAINKGMRMATGDIIGTLNSDDILASREVIGSIAHSFKYSGAEAIYGDIVYVQPSDLNNVLRIWNGSDYNRNKFKYGWMPAHPSFYIRRSLIEKYGFYETHFYSAADYEFMARYLFFHKVDACYLPKLIVKMRMGGMSNGSLSRRLRANRRDYLAMKKNNIPFPLLASILKPLSKLYQYKNSIINPFLFFPARNERPNFVPSEKNTAI